MLPVPFTFSGRIARWPFFKSSLLLGLFCVVPAFLAMTAYDQYRAGNQGAFFMALVLIGLCVVGVLWISLALQARRCRDVGWNPAWMIPAWIIVQLFDPLLAHTIPAITVGNQGASTVVGAVFNFVWFVTLAFWPSSDHPDVSAPSLPPTAPRTRMEAFAALSPAPVSVPAIGSPPRKASFGRR